jgi:hypothetical protein
MAVLSALSPYVSTHRRPLNAVEVSGLYLYEIDSDFMKVAVLSM